VPPAQGVEPADDDAALARAVGGDSIALECLLVPYQSRLLARLARKLPPTLAAFISAEDLLQETFLEVFRQIRSFEPKGRGAFVRWLIMVADGRLIHAIRQHTTLKRGGGRPGLDIMIEGSSAMPLLELLQVDTHSPSRSIAGREITGALQSALAEIHPDYREAVRLRFLENLSVQEVAARLRRTEWSIHKLCSRGLRQLREALGDEGQFLSRK
jgi:RNA polymerase sigma-70 factor (ECF subfamily)